MGTAAAHYPVVRLLAAFSQREQALDWARQTAESAWGPIALSSARYTFNETDYYTPTMGGQLQKQIWAFQELIDPAELVDAKLVSDTWESDYQDEAAGDVARALNLDPGYLTEGKLVLASTKDHSHRIYLDRGIYAEVTLYYMQKAWRTHDWTFPDYQRNELHQFFTDCREYLRKRQGNELATFDAR